MGRPESPPVLSSGVIVLFGVATGIALAFGVPVTVSFGIGLVAALALARRRIRDALGRTTAGSAPVAVSESEDEWEARVTEARRAQRAYAVAVDSCPDGSLRARAEDMRSDVDGVAELVSSLARWGRDVTAARLELDAPGARRRLRRLRGSGPSLEAARTALEQTIETDGELGRDLDDARARLVAANARLDEAVARVVRLRTADRGRDPAAVRELDQLHTALRALASDPPDEPRDAVRYEPDDAAWPSLRDLGQE